MHIWQKVCHILVTHDKRVRNQYWPGKSQAFPGMAASSKWKRSKWISPVCVLLPKVDTRVCTHLRPSQQASTKTSFVSLNYRMWRHLIAEESVYRSCHFCLPWPFKPFIVDTDVSVVEIRAILYHLNKLNVEQPLASNNCSLFKPNKKYAVVRK